MRLFFGITLLVIGFLIIFGLFDSTIFGTMFENLFFLWPFILIMIGISILSNIKGLKWLKFVNVIFIIAFTFALMFYPTDYLNDTEYTEYPFQIAISSNDIKTILEMEIGTVYLDIDTDYELSNMISGIYISDKNDLEINQSGNRIKLVRENDFKVFAFKKPRHEIHLRVPIDAYMELLIDSAVVKGDLNLKKNPFEYIDIQAAMIDLDIFLYDLTRPMYFKSETALSNIDFHVPYTTTYDDEIQSPISNFSVKDPSISDTDFNPDLIFDIKSAITNISINTDGHE